MKDNRKVPIKIDGDTFPLDGEEHLVADLLRLAGLEPAHYDLFRLDDDGSHGLDDGATITVSPGQKFVTKRQSAPVA